MVRSFATLLVRSRAVIDRISNSGAVVTSSGVSLASPPRVWRATLSCVVEFTSIVAARAADPASSATAAATTLELRIVTSAGFRMALTQRPWRANLGGL
jgi:hypothetical protein